MLPRFLLPHLLALAFLQPGHADQPGPAIFGTLIDAVRCEEDPSQSYALYVPSYYTPQRTWPVIYCFDPGAKGVRPVQKLQAAAEEYGYIVAGSLTSRNGPWADNHTAAQAMTRDVSRHFSIDPARTYTTGLSGGSRVATALALSGFSKGVIGCGAGFPVPLDSLSGAIGFPYHGTVGSEDFNYIEMVRLDRDLQSRGAIHHLEIFDGGHEWPPEAVFRGAVEWLELRAMRQGVRPLEPEFVNKIFRQRLQKLNRNDPLHPVAELSLLVRDFPERAEELQHELSECVASAAYAQALRREQALLSREESLVADTAAAAIGSAGERRRYSAKLLSRAEAAQEERERQMYRRVIAGFISVSRETIRGLLEIKDYEKAAALLDMCSLLRPGHPRTLYDLAAVRAQLKDRKAALATLGEALSAGFADLQRLESDAVWDDLREEPGFAQLIQRGKNMDHDGVIVLAPMRVSAALESVELRLFYLPHNSGAEAPPLSFLRVETVRTGTTAALAGVKANMEVTSIDGVRIRGLTESELRDLMNRNIRGELVLRTRDHARARERELRIPLDRPAPAP